MKKAPSVEIPDCQAGEGIKVQTTVSFGRLVKKLHSKDKKVLDEAVMEVAKNPFIGEEKRGDLAGLFVHKFKLNKQEAPLAYQVKPDRKKPNEIVLLSVGPHEYFYAQLKRAK